MLPVASRSSQRPIRLSQAASVSRVVSPALLAIETFVSVSGDVRTSRRPLVANIMACAATAIAGWIEPDWIAGESFDDSELVFSGGRLHFVDLKDSNDLARRFLSRRLSLESDWHVEVQVPFGDLGLIPRRNASIGISLGKVADPPPDFGVIVLNSGSFTRSISSTFTIVDNVANGAQVNFLGEAALLRLEYSADQQCIRSLC